MPTYSSALLDLCLVQDRLWIGAHPEEAWLLSSLGIDTIFLCASERQYLPQTPGITQVAMGFDDAPLAMNEWQSILGRARSVADDISKSNRNVLFSCNRGMNRAPLVGGAVLHFIGGLGGAEIIQLLRFRRDGVLSNRSFVDALSSLPAGPSPVAPRNCST